MTLDLSTLPAPEVLEALDFEDAYQESLGNFRTAMAGSWTANVESDPIVKVIEEGAYQKIQTRARVNDACKALLLAYAQGTDLDQLGANVNLPRLVIQEADATAVPPLDEITEEDDAYKERIQLAYEGLTTAGPRNSYILHARSASALVGDASAESPTPATVVITVQSLDGDGTASQALLDAVATALNDEDVRPLGDRVIVQGATVLPYQITAVLHPTGTGPEGEAILKVAQANLAAWINPRRRLGVEVARSAVDAKLHIDGISRVDLVGWTDIRPTKSQAAYCTGYSVRLAGEGDA